MFAHITEVGNCTEIRCAQQAMLCKQNRVIRTRF